MFDMENIKTSKILIASNDHRLLEKLPIWFEQNKEKIEKAANISSFWQDNVLFLEKHQKKFFNYTNTIMLQMVLISF